MWTIARMSGRDAAYKFDRETMVPKKLELKIRNPEKAARKKGRKKKKKKKAIKNLKVKESKPCVVFKNGAYKNEKCEKEASVVCKIEGKTCKN